MGTGYRFELAQTDADRSGLMTTKWRGQVWINQDKCGYVDVCGKAQL